jgi:hypothetical protein
MSSRAVVVLVLVLSSLAVPLGEGTAAQAAAPVNTAEPATSGRAEQGIRLTASTGTWTGTQPISFAYQWVRCGLDGGRPDGSNCAIASGATNRRYRLASADVGFRMRARVTAKNADGSTSVASNPTNVVVGPPVNTSTPSVRGTMTVGSVVTADPGGWTGCAAHLLLVSLASLQHTGRELHLDQGVVVSPNPVTSRSQPITVRVRVKDTRGFAIRDALVFVRSTPRVTSGGDRQAPTVDSWVTYQLAPNANFPKPRSGFNVQFFVKAYRSGDPALAGVAGYRLVQGRLAG